MLLTEDEAKTKWCPFVRASIYEAADNDVSGNRAGPLRESGGCIASACMAWRWGEPGFQTEFEYGEANRRGERAITGSRQVPLDRPRRGYCGLGGRPE